MTEQEISQEVADALALAEVAQDDYQWRKCLNKLRKLAAKLPMASTEWWFVARAIEKAEGIKTARELLFQQRRQIMKVWKN